MAETPTRPLAVAAISSISFFRVCFSELWRLLCDSVLAVVSSAFCLLPSVACLVEQPNIRETKTSPYDNDDLYIGMNYDKNDLLPQPLCSSPFCASPLALCSLLLPLRCWLPSAFCPCSYLFALGPLLLALRPYLLALSA